MSRPTTVLVTGGTGGIGRATADGAVRSRRPGRHRRPRPRTGTERWLPQTASRSTGRDVDVFVADMSAQAEVRRLAAEVLGAYPRLDVLVNNVGGYWAHRHVTVDGLEHTFALNHLAPFLLTELLLDRLRASAPARVVTVSSGAQSMGRIDFDDLQASAATTGQHAYNQSKLANVLFTLRARPPPRGDRGHRQRAPPRRGANRLRPGGRRPVDAPAAAGRAPVHEDTRSRGRDLDLPRLGPRARGGQRSLLRHARPQRKSSARSYDCGRGAQTVGDERAAGRAQLRHPSEEERPHEARLHLVGFGVPADRLRSAGTLAEVGRAADEAGVDVLSLMDHYFQLAFLGDADGADARGLHHARLPGRAHLAGRAPAADHRGHLPAPRHPREDGGHPRRALRRPRGARASAPPGTSGAPRPGRAVPAAGRAVRAARGDAADRRQMWSDDDGPVPRQALPAGRDDLLPAAAHPVRRSWSAAAGSGRRCASSRSTPTPATSSPAAGTAPDAVARKLAVLREHCEREGRPYDAIRRTVLWKRRSARTRPAGPPSSRRCARSPTSACRRSTSCRCRRRRAPTPSASCARWASTSYRRCATSAEQVAHQAAGPPPPAPAAAEGATHS